MASNPNRPQPNYYFNAYIVKRNSAGNYTVVGSAVKPAAGGAPAGSKTKFDIYDTGAGDPAGDLHTQLGDVSGDHYTVRGTLPSGEVNVPATAVFEGSTSNGKSFVGKYSGKIYYAGGTGYYLYTNNTYANGTTFTTKATPFNLCFVAGTRIRGLRGDIPVEQLRVGDLVVTASGAHRPIRWLGHRTVDCRKAARPAEALPVRIAAHAIGENQPARDLWVSPAHAICVDVVGERLVPAIDLVNGSTIAQMDVDSVTYWHVELDEHDIILAENLPAESYIDCGHRDFFVEGGVVELAAMPDQRHPTTDDYCRPFHHDDALAALVQSRLAARAEALARAGVDQGETAAA